MWKDRKDVKGDHYLVAWNKVAFPKENRGIGIPNMSQGYHGRLNIHVPHLVLALFYAASTTKLGSGDTTVFWVDKWLNGKKMDDTSEDG
jgi:hypothetical protein